MTRVGGLSLSLLVTAPAVVSYSTLRSKRLPLATIAFANFALTQALMLFFHMPDPPIIDLGDTDMYEVGHLLMFVTLGLLAVGALRND